MKVLLVSSNSGSRGGGEIYLRYLAEGLCRLGCEVHALVGADARMDELAAGIEKAAVVHRLELTNAYRRPMRSLGAVLDADQRRRARQFIERLAPDLAHVNQQVTEDGLDMLLAARASDRPLVSTVHITQSAKDLAARFAWARDLAVKHVFSRTGLKCIAVSGVTAQRLRTRMPYLTATAISVVHYGVPTQDHRSFAENRAQARNEWGFADNDIAIGAVGRIEDQKNPLYLVDLLADLLASGRRARLVWIGNGTLRPALERRARARGVADRVVVDGWRDDASLRMTGLDILAMPSRFEGLPLALLEAMHAGLAVCVSDADGIPEAVTDGRDGLIRPISTPADWREAVGGLVDDAEARARLGAAARETARARFSLEAMARATFSLYQRTIAETAPGPSDALAG